MEERFQAGPRARTRERGAKWTELASQTLTWERSLDGGQKYLTVDEVAEVLRVSAPTVYRLAKRDPTLPVLRLPGLMRFPRERLLRWLRDREQGQGRARGIGRQVTVPRKTLRDHAGSQA